jgi:hypothetical protein
VIEPAFYSYTAAESRRGKLVPGGWCGAANLRGGAQQHLPHGDHLEFMESTYEAGAKCAGWDIEALRTHLPAREAVKLRRGN